MTQTELHDKANKLVTLLGFSETVAAAGETWCSVNALMLTLSLNSCTQDEADERITEIVANVEAKLKQVM